MTETRERHRFGPPGRIRQRQHGDAGEHQGGHGTAARPRQPLRADLAGAGHHVRGRPVAQPPLRADPHRRLQHGRQRAPTPPTSRSTASRIPRAAAPAQIAAGYVPPADAIGEVRIETNSFDARAGQTSGGLVNISLRSGTNKIRGNGTFTKMTAAVDGEHLVRQPQRFRARRLRLQPLERIAERTDRPAEDLQRPQPDVLHVGVRSAHGPAARAAAPPSPCPPRPSARATSPSCWASAATTRSTTRARGAARPAAAPATARTPSPATSFPSNRFDPVAMKVMEYFPLPLNEGHHRRSPQQLSQAEFARDCRLLHPHGARGPQLQLLQPAVRARQRLRAQYAPQRLFRNARHGHAASSTTPSAAPSTTCTRFRPPSCSTCATATRASRARPTRFYGRNFDLTSLGFPKSFASLISPDNSEFPAFEIQRLLQHRPHRRSALHGYALAGGRVHAAARQPHPRFRLRVPRLPAEPVHRRHLPQRPLHLRHRPGRAARSTTPPPRRSARAGRRSCWGCRATAPTAYVARPADFAEQSTVWCGYIQDSWRVRRNLTINLGCATSWKARSRSATTAPSATSTPMRFCPSRPRRKAAYAASYAANPTTELPPDQFTRARRPDLRRRQRTAARAVGPRHEQFRAAHRPGLDASPGARCSAPATASIFGPLGHAPRRREAERLFAQHAVRPHQGHRPDLLQHASPTPSRTAFWNPRAPACGSMTDVGNSDHLLQPAPHGQLQPALADQHPAPVPRAAT